MDDLHDPCDFARWVLQLLHLLNLLVRDVCQRVQLCLLRALSVGESFVYSLVLNLGRMVNRRLCAGSSPPALRTAVKIWEFSAMAPRPWPSAKRWQKTETFRVCCFALKKLRVTWKPSVAASSSSLELQLGLPIPSCAVQLRVS